MRQLGAILAIFGLGSFVLNMMGLEFSLLMWIDNWGTTAGTGIRFGMIALGAVLFFMGSDD